MLKILWEDWADREVELPHYATEGAAGADVRANLPPEIREAGFTLQPGERAVVPTGLRMAIPDGYELQIRARSGLAKNHGLGLPNAPGTIDSDYRGPVGVLLINWGAEPYTISHGERIAQMIVAPVVQVAFEVTDSLDETARGTGGFGSTGRH
nr:dUTP diphosphatase [Pseudoruegeria sp. HB172150]